ncbi:tetratricopeptide repeat protein [Candidatus Desantisbacteria bacterium]|nr:tetratricopeptide repeat protein [Candidatus Desantisbacteria bacterium]
MYHKLDKYPCQALKIAAIIAIFVCSFSLPAFSQTAKETFLEGNEYLQKENFSQAITAYQQTIKLNPYHKIAYHNLGKCYLGLNLFAKAEECFKKALKLDTDYISAINKLGVAYEYQKKYSQAWNCYNRVLEINPIEAEAHYNLSSLFQKKRDFEKAILHAQKAIKTKPNYVEALVKLGDIYWKSYHNMDKASIYYKRAKEIEPENKLVRCCLAEMYTQEGLIEDAERECLEMVSIDPLSVAALSQLVKIYTNQGRYEKIGPLCQRIINITPADSKMLSYSSMLSSMITLFVEQGIEKNADILSQKLISLTPGSKTFDSYLSTLTNLITFMFDKKRYEKAAPFCKKISTLVPSGKALNPYRDTLNRLVKLYFSNKRYKDSIPLCQRVIGISPASGIAHYQLSIAYKGMGEYKGCASEALKSCRIDPFDEIFWHIVEKGILNINRQQVGTPLRNECSKRHLEMAQYYLGLGNISLAEYEYKKARQLNPQSILVRLGLAKCYDEIDLVAKEICEEFLTKSITVSSVPTKEIQIMMNNTGLSIVDNLQTAVQLATNLGASYLLWGDIQEEKGKICIESQLLNLKKASPKKEREFLHVSRNRDCLTKCISYLSQDLSNFFPVQGEIVSLSRTSVVLNLGEKHGAKPGFICDAFDSAGQKITEIEIVEVSDNSSRGIITTISGIRQILPHNRVILRKGQVVKETKGKKEKKK